MNNIYSVGQANRYIRNMFAQDFFLRRISIKGEVSNCKYHTSNHLYFSLKDDTGCISCVMFARDRRGLSFRMKDGDKVVVTGSVEVYERDGKYQLYAKEISLEGAGALYERYLALKQELEDMGMFSPEYKQPVPRFVKRLGVVTAPTGAAVQDIRTVSLRRNPYIQIILYPALVQGTGAAESIARGIRMLDAAGVDVIIAGRGGGSIEDLWAFNEEIVARAIFECRTPVISAVGHETDFTIADFVADMRAPTPSAAAEMAVEDLSQVLENLSVLQRRMIYAMTEKSRRARQDLAALQQRIRILGPDNRLKGDRQHLIDLEDRLQALFDRSFQANRHRLLLFAERLSGLSPLEKLKSGYAYVTGPDGHSVIRTDQVKTGDALRIRVTDGTILAQVTAAGKIEDMKYEHK